MNQHHRKIIFFYTAIIVKQLTLTFILTCCQLTLIYCRYFWIVLTIRSVITKNNMLAKCIVLSNIISVVSDNILRIYIQEPLLILKKFIVLYALSAYNSLLVCCKVCSSDAREYLCTSWRYAEAYGNFSIDPAPCWKNPPPPITTTTTTTTSWFSLNNSRTVKAITLEFCSVK